MLHKFHQYNVSCCGLELLNYMVFFLLLLLKCLADLLGTACDNTVF
jgi:hypothetical protein